MPFEPPPVSEEEAFEPPPLDSADDFTPPWTNETQRAQAERGPRPIAESLPVVPRGTGDDTLDRLQASLQTPAPAEQSLSEITIPGVFGEMGGDEGAFETLMQPVVELPAVPAGLMQGVLSPLLPGETGAKISEGAGKFVSKAVSSLTSPGMIGIGALAAVAPPVASAVIAGMGASGIGPASVEAIEASKRGDLAQFTEHTLDAAMAGTMGSIGVRGLAKPTIKAVNARLKPGVTDKAFQPLASKTIEQMLAERPPVLETTTEKGAESAKTTPETKVSETSEVAETTGSAVQSDAQGPGRGAAEASEVLLTPAAEVAKPVESLVAGPKTVEPALESPTTVEATLTPEQVYDASLEAFKAESRKFTKLTKAYRSKQIGDAEFLAGKAEFDKASEVADAAETAFIEAKNNPTVAATTIAAENQGQFTGMGGAVPGEFAAGQGQPTAMKFRQIDLERQKRGLPPIPKPEGTKDQIVWDRALAEIDKDPTLPERLIKELNDPNRDARPIEPWENHVIMLRKIDLKNEYAKATRDLAQAFEDGRMDDVAAIRPRVQVWSEQLTELETASRRSGSARGAALRALQVMANEDFSLAQLEMNKRADVGGRPLTDAERTDLVRINRELEATQKAFETRVADLESKLSSAEAQTALAQAKASVAAEPTYPKPVLEAAERIVQGWEKRGEAAAERLRKKLGQLGTTPDPTIIIDLAEIGIAKFGRGALDFAKWSEAMLKDFGPKIEPFLKDAYDAAQKLLDAETTKITGPLSDQVKRRIKKTDVAEKITDAKEKIAVKVQKGETESVTPNVNALVRALVEQEPSISRDGLVDTVHNILKDLIPEITRQEAADAISGRGKFWLPPQDAVSKTVRDLKTQIRLVEHQADVIAGRPLPRTGYQPEPLTDAARAEAQKLNELKRQHGVVVTDPASQLASTLAARKTYYRHRIADLQQEIAAGERTIKTRSPSPTDPQLESMRAELAKLKEEHEAIFGKAEKTPEQRVAAAMSAVERSITDLEARIKSGDIGPRSRESKTPNTPELEAARARRDALKEELQELRDIANPKKTPEERALQSLKTRLKTRVAELREKLAAGDFSPRAKRPPLDLSKDTEAMRLKAEHETVKREYEQARIRDQAKNMTGGQKTWANIKETANLYRNYKTSFDLSAILRQGGPFTFSHPIKAARIVGATLRSFASEKIALTEEQRIWHRPNAHLYARDKLYLPKIFEARLSAQEEMVMSRLASRIPGIRASNRAYITFLNRARVEYYDAMTEGWAFKQGAPTAAEGRIIAQAVNTASGRGSLGRFEPAGEFLSTVLFSPRLLVSRFQILAGQPFYGGNARTRKAIATEYARTLVGVGAAYGLATLAGAEIETDSRSSDFGKFKWGNTRLDPLMGLAQVTVLVSRLTTGETKGLRTGKITDLRADRPKFGQADSADVIARFLRTKIAPALGLGLDVVTGSNVVGEPVTPGSVAKDILVPISYGDILAVMEEQGIPRGTALELLNLLGMGLQHFNSEAKHR